MPRPLPADGVAKGPLTTRWTMTDRAKLEAECARTGVTMAKLLEVSAARFLGLSEGTRDKLLSA